MEHGFIYSLFFDNLYYYGSSIHKNRFTQHKIDYNLWKAKKQHYKSSYIVFQEAEKYGKLPSFEVLYVFPNDICCCCRRMEEQKYIKNNECVNKYNAYISKEERILYLKEYRKNKKNILVS